MKTRKKRALKTAAPAPAAASSKRWWYVVGFLLLLGIGFQAYGPVLNGPFLFDDAYLFFNLPDQPVQMHFTLIRPVLMYSYWFNYLLSGRETFSYHAFNVLCHVSNSLLIFLILRRLLSYAGAKSRGRREGLAAFAAALFLVHPLATESVAYVASRSENLSLLFFLAAFALFLYRKAAAIAWHEAAGVLFLFILAAGTKEHTIALVPLLLLTDYYWNPGFSWKGMRSNWRLYAPIVLAGMGGLYFVWKVLHVGTTAGFGIKDFTWYQYFFTQCRAFFLYLRLFVLPVRLTADYDFPISHTVFEHGAIFGLLGILLLTAVAIYFRRRYPLASYGFLAFVILLAPTSSFVPIKDPVAERRVYLAMIGLLCILLDGLWRLKIRNGTRAAALVAVLLAADVMTWQRNFIWSDELALWEDTVQKSPRQPRAHFQLAYAYYHEGRCDQALPHYQAVADLQPVSADLLVDWALAYDCVHQPGPALEKLRRAVAMQPSAHIYSQIGMVYAKAGQWKEALDALATAEKMDPSFGMTYVYRGGVYERTGEFALAAQNYRRALSIDPANKFALDGLQRLRAAR